jgi:hypothetical protein
MTFQEAIALLQGVGFPIFMVVWFMLRTEQVIRDNTAAVNALAVGEERERELLATLVTVVTKLVVERG